MVRKQHEMEWLSNRGEHVEREGVETIFDVVKRACRTNETPDANWHPQVQSRPTQTSVGSLERVEEYARRVERGEELWNEQDPTCFARAGEGRPEVYRFAGSQVRTIREDY